MNDLIAAIDPGAKGGLCVMASCGAVLYASPIPTLTEGRLVRPSVGQLVGVFRHWFWGPNEMRGSHVVIETPPTLPGSKRGKVGTTQIMVAYGMILGCVRAIGLRTCEVAPQEWQPIILGRVAGDDAAARRKAIKASSVAWVGANHPAVNLRPGKLRKGHDGIADAVCLAEYGRRVYLGAEV